MLMLFAQCSNTQHNDSERKQLIEQYKKSWALIEKENERSDIINKSKTSENYSLYNVYIAGKSNIITVYFVFNNSRISKKRDSLLIPTRIINNTNDDLLLNPETDKLFFIFKRGTHTNNRPLYSYNMPSKILPGKDSYFITKYNFKDNQERTGFSMMLHMTQIYLDGLNSGKSIANTNEFKKNENEINEMNKLWRGKFEIKSLGKTVPLNFCIKNNHY